MSYEGFKVDIELDLHQNRIHPVGSKNLDPGALPTAGPRRNASLKSHLDLCRGLYLITTPEVTNTGPGFSRGSGGGARGCGFEERVGVHARTGGIHFLQGRFELIEGPTQYQL